MRRRDASIRKIVDPPDIHHVRPKWNPATASSREIDPRKFVGHDLRLSGPPFLRGELPTTSIASGVVTCGYVVIGHPEPITARVSYC